MQIRPLCGHYTRVNTPLVGAGKTVLLTLPYQIDILPGQVRLMLYFYPYLTRLIAYLAMLGY